MSFKISIPNKNKIKPLPSERPPPSSGNKLHYSDINLTPSDKIHRFASNSDRAFPDRFASHSGMKSGLEKDIFSKKPSFLYENSTSGAVGLAEYRENKPSFLEGGYLGQAPVLHSDSEAAPVSQSETEGNGLANYRSEFVVPEVTAERPLPLAVTSGIMPRYSTINIKNFLNNCDSIK